MGENDYFRLRDRIYFSIFSEFKTLNITPTKGLQVMEGVMNMFTRDALTEMSVHMAGMSARMAEMEESLKKSEEQPQGDTEE